MDIFSKYLKGCEVALNEVDKALSKGEIVFSRDERLDYYFKSVLLYRTDIKKLMLSRSYRLAKFFEVCYNEIKKIYRTGYDNRSAVKSFKKINKASTMYLHCGSKYVEAADANGSLYVYLADVRDKRFEYEWQINSVESLIDSIEDCVKYLVKSTGEYTSFAEGYLTWVLNEVYGEISVEPYKDMNIKKTIGYAVEKSNIVQLNSIERNGGNDYGRYGRYVVSGR